MKYIFQGNRLDAVNKHSLQLLKIHSGWKQFKQVYLLCIVPFSKSSVKNVKLPSPYCVENFSVFDFSLSSYFCVCVSFKPLLLLPYLPCTTFLPSFHCNSRTSYSGNNDLHWYDRNSVTSIRIEINKCIAAQHLFYGQ